MSSDNTALGNRMKGYEAATRFVLPRRTYSVVRVDGRAFHGYLRHAERPFSGPFMDLMDAVAAALCAEMSGAAFAYVQSDEISVLLTDFGSVHSEPWFAGGVQKIASMAASTATAAFNGAVTSGLVPSLPVGRALATFDGRVFTIPEPVEVANYFVWRQRDCTRNSISMAAQAHFPHKRLQGLDGNAMQELLWQEKGVNWSHYPDGAKRGRVVQRVTAEEPVTYTDKRDQQVHTIEAVRSHWVAVAAPGFTAGPGGFLASVIPPLPALALAEVPA